ncbi:hypothetical protein GCM10008908_21320 [Clostridium subterminale]|uniref:Glycosyltransferase 2-like domain-containing protein n=1 Tax=Clostridium subterminale TaxID=1550 RepID=A0ABN1KQ87_CLOSU
MYDSFIKQSYPGELITIVIADGMSTDNTRKIIDEYKSKYGNIILVDNLELTAPKGMNLGIRATDSDIVIILELIHLPMKTLY